ncbi:short chain dehydrogenase [Aspergillus aurantiobrunneus]
MPTFSSQDIPDLHDQLSLHNPGRIYLAARSKDKATKAIKRLQEASPEGADIQFLQLDLPSFKSVKAAAARFLSRETRLDILVNNAGIILTPEGLTKEGYERQFGTNVIGPALFTQLLMPVLQKTVKINSQTRMVMLSSAAHARAPSNVYKFDEVRSAASNRHTTQRYTMSELADLHYAKALAERDREVKIIPVHPGMVATDIHHAATGIFLKPFLYTAVVLFATPVEKGALSQIFKSGQYYGPVGKAESGSKLAQDHGLRETLFKWVQEQLAGHVETLY